MVLQTYTPKEMTSFLQYRSPVTYSLLRHRLGKVIIPKPQPSKCPDYKEVEETMITRPLPRCVSPAEH